MTTIDHLLRYRLRLERLSYGTMQELLRDVDRAIDQVTAALEGSGAPREPLTATGLERSLPALRNLKADLRQELAAKVEEMVLAAAVTVGPAVAGAMTSVSVPADYISASVSTRARALADAPIDGLKWPQWGARLGDDVIQRVNGAIREAYAVGESIRQASKRVREVIPLAKASAQKLTRTAMTDVASRGALEAYRVARVERVRFIAVLDNRTSVQCASFSGLVFPIGAAPRPPLHPNCRSVLAPVLPGEDGAAWSDLDGETWLRSQPEEFQREWLGPARLRAWKNGLPLGSMANADRALTVDELKRLYPLQMEPVQ